MATKKRPSQPEVLATPQPVVSDPIVLLMAARYADNGPNPEYKTFEAKLKPTLGSLYKRATDIWQFIDDAVTGDGGFSDGSYLFPTKGEVSVLGVYQDKFLRRMAMADYNEFPGHICNAAWELIVGSSDMIERKSKEGHDAAPLLASLWVNCDGRGTSLFDFLEFAHGQARRYGTGYIIVDRTARDLRDKSENLAPENAPYLYSVPSRNVVDWKFSEDGRTLDAITILEPIDGAEKSDRAPFRVWTRNSWATFVPLDKKNEYALSGSGQNALGVVPVVPVWNETPKPGTMLGKTEMYGVARFGQTVYNVDSEKREIERKCATFLAMPVKDIAGWSQDKAVIGSDSLLLYDGEAGEPRYVSPDLQILASLSTEREEKIDSAYEMAHLRALRSGAGNQATTEKTSSGYHAEIENDKAERRVGRHAQMLEQTEKRVVEIFLSYYGIDAKKERDVFSVSYPRNFGVRDMQKLITDVTVILDENVGEEWEREELTKLAKARFPRLDEKRIQLLVDGAVKARATAQQQQSSLDRVKAMASQIRTSQVGMMAKGGSETTNGTAAN